VRVALAEAGMGTGAGTCRSDVLKHGLMVLVKGQEAGEGADAGGGGGGNMQE
jgi:hypothetical protein